MKKSFGLLLFALTLIISTGCGEEGNSNVAEDVSQSELEKFEALQQADLDAEMGSMAEDKEAAEGRPDN